MSDAGRRHSGRIEVNGHITISTVPWTTRLTLIDVGGGGFLVSGRHAFVVGSEHSFLLAASDRSWFMAIEARAVHAHIRHRPGSDEAEYVTGFTFTQTVRPLVRAQIVGLLERVVERVFTPPPAPSWDPAGYVAHGGGL